jgi:hypothetical protein
MLLPLRTAIRSAQEWRIADAEPDDSHADAADFATARIAAVRDDPAGRLALARSIYDDSTGRPSQRQRFRRAALAFTRWMAERGVLNTVDGPQPGSNWWRAMNERLLRDSCEASDAPRAGAARRRPTRSTTGPPSSIGRRRNPGTARTTQASSPPTSTTVTSPLARIASNRVLDYAVVIPRLRPLYDWSARELARPELSDLLVDDAPAYAWPPDDRQPWMSPPLRPAVRALKALTAPRQKSKRGASA